MLILTFIIAVLALTAALIQTKRKDHVAELEAQLRQYQAQFNKWDKAFAQMRLTQEEDWQAFVDYTKYVKPLIDKNSTKYNAILTQLNDLQHAIYDEEVPIDDNSINTKESAQAH